MQKSSIVNWKKPEKLKKILRFACFGSLPGFRNRSENRAISVTHTPLLNRRSFTRSDTHLQHDFLSVFPHPPWLLHTRERMWKFLKLELGFSKNKIMTWLHTHFPTSIRPCRSTYRSRFHLLNICEKIWKIESQLFTCRKL